MRCATALMLASLLVLAGCGQASSPVEREEKQHGLDEEADLPTYDITAEQNCPQGNISAKCYSVSTNATSTENFETLTRYFRDENPDPLAVIVTFFPNKAQAESSGSGASFKNEAAARTILTMMYPQGADVEPQVEKAMDNDGIWVLSVEDTVDAVAKEMCAEWDTTTMGTPPPEWDCPGY